MISFGLVNGSEVYIDIYDDRMEIYSPGGMSNLNYDVPQDVSQDVPQDKLDAQIVEYICIPVTEYMEKKSWYGYFKNIENKGRVIYG